MIEPFRDFVTKLIDEYLQLVRSEFQSRINAWETDVFEKETNEVVGGLMARQLTLATEIAKSPQSWKASVLPILLRCMADVYITFCWILADPKSRSRQFIEYGLGQEKLLIEKSREALAQGSDPDPDGVEMINLRAARLEAERFSFLIPVNLGSWNEKNAREMAIEVGEKEFYDFVFTQFSATVHSTWQHIWQFNLRPCTNPLHMGHRVPVDPELPIDGRTFVLSAKYLCMTFSKFDQAALKVEKSDAFKPYEFLWGRLTAYFESLEEDEGKVP